jgi:hypothetical protein
MSQQKKLEQILNLLVNEEMGQAEALLHELVIEKARYIYEELVNDEDQDEEEMEESIGGDMKQGFTDEVSAAEDDIETDELQDGEVEVDDAEEEMSIDDKVEDLEVQLADLRAEFEQLMSDELEEPYHDAEDFSGDYDDGEMEVDFGSDDDFEQRLGEATNFSNDVSISMDTEGKLVGAGKSIGATGTESPYTNAPTQFISGADPVNFTKGNDKAGGATPSSKNETPSDNINAPQQDRPDTGQTGTAGFVGTGKGSTKGAEGTKSPLSKMPRR